VRLIECSVQQESAVLRDGNHFRSGPEIDILHPFEKVQHELLQRALWNKDHDDQRLEEIMSKGS
jgi:hypothetical protein